MDDGFLKAARYDEVEEGGIKFVVVEGEPILLSKFDGEVYAISDICAHRAGALHEGTVFGDEVECRLHGSSFNLKTGEPLAFPVFGGLVTYQVRVEGDDVLVNPEPVFWGD